MINEEYILKYLKHELSEKEAAEVVAWLEKDKSNQEFLFSIKEAYLLSRYKMDTSKADTDEEWESLKENIQSVEQPSSSLKRFLTLRSLSSYAAVILVCVFLGWKGNEVYKDQIHKDMMQTIETGTGQQVKTTLPDGTCVSLNACTRLSYSPFTWDKQRIVQLKGEAIFDVAANKDKPFTVETANYDIYVTGTNFNVSCYEEDGKSITTLTRGKVNILTTNHGTLMAELSPGESLIFDNVTKEYKVAKLSIGHIYAWNNKEIIFEGNTLEEKKAELYRHFGYTFIIAPELQKLTYKATLRDESLTEFVGILNRITPNIHYQIQEKSKTVFISTHN